MPVRKLRFIRTKALGVSLAVVAIAATGCSSNGTTTSDSPTSQSGTTEPNTAAYGRLPSAIRSSGVLSVASSVGFPPYEFIAPDNKTYIGLDVDIINALGGTLGVKVKINNVAFPNIQPSMQAKRYDAAISALTETPSDEQSLNFVSYFRAATGMLVSGSDSSVKSGQPLSLCGKRVGIVGGESSLDSAVASTSQQCKSAGKPSIQVKTFQTTSAAILAIESGQLDTRYADVALGQYLAKNSAGKVKFVANVLPIKPLMMGIGVPKSDPELLRALQTGMQQLLKSGKYAEILSKWQASAGALSTITTVDTP